MKKYRTIKRGLFLFIMLFFILSVPIKAKAETQVISSYGSWIQGTNAYNRVYGKVDSQDHTSIEEIGDPNWFDVLLGSALAYLGDFIDYWIAGPFHMQTDEIILGRLTEGVTMNMYAFELVAKNPYGLTGAAFYKVFRNMAYMLLGIVFIAILIKTAIDQTPRALSNMKNDIYAMVIIAIVLAIAPQLIDIMLFLKDLIMTMILGIVYGSTKIDTVSITAYFREMFFGNADTGVEGTKSLANGFLYLTSTFIGLRYGINYIKIALKQTALFIILPIVLLLAIFNKNIMRGWSRRFIPNSFIPAIDLGLLMIPVVYAKVTSLYMSNTLAGTAAADYDLLSGIIQIIMMFSLIPIREMVLEVFDAIPDRARPQGGAAGMVAALMASQVLRNMMSGGGKGAESTAASAADGASGGFNGGSDGAQRRILDPSAGDRQYVHENMSYGGGDEPAVGPGSVQTVYETAGDGPKMFSDADQNAVEQYLSDDDGARQALNMESGLLGEEVEDRINENRQGIDAQIDTLQEAGVENATQVGEVVPDEKIEAVEPQESVNISDSDSEILASESNLRLDNSGEVVEGDAFANVASNDSVEFNNTAEVLGPEQVALAEQNQSILRDNGVSSLSQLEAKEQSLIGTVAATKEELAIAQAGKSAVEADMAKASSGAGGQVSPELTNAHKAAVQEVQQKTQAYNDASSAYNELHSSIEQYKTNEAQLRALDPQTRQNRERLQSVADGVNIDQSRITDAQKQQYERKRSQSMMQQIRDMTPEQRVGAIVGGTVAGAALVGAGATAVAVAAASNAGDDRNVGRSVTYTAIGAAAIGQKVAVPIANTVGSGAEKVATPIIKRHEQANAASKEISAKMRQERDARVAVKNQNKEGIKVGDPAEKITSEEITSSDGRKAEHVQEAKELKQRLEKSLND